MQKQEGQQKQEQQREDQEKLQELHREDQEKLQEETSSPSCTAFALT